MTSKLFKFFILLKFTILVHTFADIDTINPIQNGFTIYGDYLDSPGDVFGVSLSSGDFNGDGIRDVVIGAYNADYQSRVNVGIAYVFMGKTSGLSTIDVVTNWTSSQGFRIIGDSAGVGYSLSNIGDINGDGADDIIVGAHLSSPSLSISPYLRGYAGTAYVIFGQRNTYTDVDVGTNLVATGRGFKILGADTYNFLGMSVSGLGDVNGDGINDMIVAAPSADPDSSRADAGIVYVIFGQSSNTDIDLSTTNIRTSGKGIRIYGAVANDMLGNVGSAGDINNDGVKDILVGTYRHTPYGRNSAGMVYVIFGRSNIGDVDLANSLSGVGFTISGAAPYDQLGSALSAGDVNGDGISDLLLTANGVNGLTRTDNGALYVIFGWSGISTIDLGSSFTSSQGFTIFGAVSGDSSATSVSSLGDVNGDGIGDLIYGAITFDPPGRTNGGAAYIIFGRSSGNTNIDLNNLDTGSGYKIIGAKVNEWLGTSVAGVGDMNQDGINDIIVGASVGIRGSGREGAAKVHVIFLPCDAGENKIFNNQCYTSCSSGLFPLSGAKCGACTTGCSNCTGSGATCTLCDSSHYLHNSLCYTTCPTGSPKMYNRVCYASCPAGTYPVSGNQCMACETGCLSCPGSGATCTLCDTGYNKLYNGTCYASCPAGTYSTSGTGCSLCETGCLSCSGSGPTCSLCDSGYPKLYNDTCYNTCPSGTYSTSGTGCSQCEAGCLTCSGSGPTCTLCDTGYNKLYNGTCYASCPAGTYSTSGTGCSPCETGCSSCSGTGPTCSLCDSGYAKLYNGTCYTTCPSGTYSTSGTGCSPCETGCLSCSGSGPTCSLCDSGHAKLYNDTCYNTCPSGTYSTSGTGCSECEAGCLACSGSGTTCSLCNSSAGYLKLSGGVCYQSCPDGSYSTANGCEACQNGCSICSGKENCTSCDSSFGYMKLYNGICYSSCPDNTYSNSENGCAPCNKKCPNCLDYYFPQEGICDSKCQYPYQVTNPLVCELPLLSSDEMATIKSTSTAIDIANQMTRITTTIAIPITAYDPWFMMFISSTQLLFYVRHMEVGFSPQLQKVFQAKKDPILSLQIDSDTNDVNSLPLSFKQYLVPPRFLVNFWQPTLTLIIIVSVILLVGFLKKIVVKNIRLHSMLEKIHLTLKWNYFLTNFTSYYHLLVLYTSVELRTLKLDSFVQVLSLLICLLINSLGFIVPFHLFRVVRSYRNQSSKVASSSANLSSQENLSKKWQSYEVILKPFKDSLVQQIFIPIWILKTYLFTFILAYLFDYPLTQGILLTILSWSMLLYLIITRPVKNKVTQVQYLVMEMMFCLVSLCVLILGGLDQADAIASETREGLSNTILYSVLTFTWAGQVSLVVKTILDIRAYYYEKKVSKQTQTKVENLESKEDQSPLANNNNIELAKHKTNLILRTNLIPENQDIEKEPNPDLSPINSPTSFSESKQLFWKAPRNMVSKEEQDAINENNIQIIDLRENDKEIVDTIGLPSREISPLKPKESEDKDHRNVLFGIMEQKEFDTLPVGEKDVD